MNQHTFPCPEVVAAVRSQWASLFGDARRLAPTLAEELTGWAGSVLGARPQAAFTALESYPLVHLPVWATPGLDPVVLARLVRSSISGYLYVRLVDNGFDADTDGAELRILPATAYLHTQFQLPYQELFGFGHPFWAILTSAWTRAAEAMLADRLLRDHDVDRFESVAARKTTSAIIPVAAALYAVGQPHRLPAWERFVGTFGRWHQLENDFFGWRKDQRHGNPNLVLSEALRRDADPDDWFFKQGFEWGARLLSRYASEVATDAAALDAPGLSSYLKVRLSAHRARLDTLRSGIAENVRLERLLATLGRQTG